MSSTSPKQAHRSSWRLASRKRRTKGPRRQGRWCRREIEGIPRPTPRRRDAVRGPSRIPRRRGRSRGRTEMVSARVLRVLRVRGPGERGGGGEVGALRPPRRAGPPLLQPLRRGVRRGVPHHPRPVPRRPRRDQDQG
uniref:Uncharacterized protein n=1 Tax=Setaria viridis TaxID=4556 RepID=A0A4V6DAK5_SETVI|nr:hypothetical protein SEVIR_2G009160v2 [Setaria viridis]